MGYGLYFFIDIQTSSKPQQKTRLVVIEDKDESPGTTRASHRGWQGRLTEGDKDESPRVTRASHPGQQGRVTREDKTTSSVRTITGHRHDGKGTCQQTSFVPPATHERNKGAKTVTSSHPMILVYGNYYLFPTESINPVLWPSLPARQSRRKTWWCRA